MEVGEQEKHISRCLIVTNRLIKEEMEYDSVSEKQLFNELHSGFNSEQLEVYDTIMNTYNCKKWGLFFLYGSGGTRKTYLWKTLIAKFRSEEKIVLSVASFAIAALLLPGGRTVHSRFKIPINLDEFSSCSINQQTELAKLIQEASLIIWDEAPMHHHYGFEAVNPTFRDILKGTKFFSTDCVIGGKLFILGGDFRKILPVVPKGRWEATIAASLKESTIWNHCRVLHLRTNMRIMAHDTSIQMRQQLRDFANWILMIGDGKIPGISFIEGGETNWIEIPEQFLIRNGSHALHDLIHAICPELSTRYSDSSYLKECGILAPKNADVDELNVIMLSMLPGES
ncbi:uncharacterized protein LOC114286753 [Camellia sinensis]|uniref:uncharacterized protein LOC114286753 n=1 Tax=Camellia sinensis TaxID=4442 RepID=UPI0010367D65|nr:uncharacterized protein LOC114286753 [Camellia sinensis]